MLLIQMTDQDFKDTHRSLIREELQAILSQTSKDEPVESDNNALTIDEAASRLRVSKVTLHRLMNDGELTFFKVRRRTYIQKDSLEAYIARNTVHHKQEEYAI